MSTKMATRPVMEFWMELKDVSLLASLMETKGISARKLSEAAGWRSHTYLQRILRGGIGAPTTMKAEPAARIAHTLEVPFNLLFVARSSEKSAQSVQQKEAS